MKKIRVNKNKSKEWPKWSIGYGTMKVQLPYPHNPREGVCDACGRSIRKGEITVTHLHHWIYKYKHAKIKKDPFLVLNNLSELCYSCHRIADALREFLFLKKDNMWMTLNAALLMSDDMLEKMDLFARGWIMIREKEPKKKTLMDYSKA